MSTPFTHKKLTDVKDSAPEFGMEEVQEARFAKGDLDAEKTGVSHHRLKPGQRTPFGHKHEDAEEVYIVIAGSGRMKLDDEIIEVETLDAIRVSPEVVRAFEADSEGIEVLAVGARHDGDGEVIPGWWTD
jgi:mannose-6-phosphate isomerase-like protein (cupin superfamily)